MLCLHFDPHFLKSKYNVDILDRYELQDIKIQVNRLHQSLEID